MRTLADRMDTPVASRPRIALASLNVRPSKGRGQNFLVQPAIADRIVAAAEPGIDDEVVEIGPGLGILSERILSAGVRRFTMIELDRRLAAGLESRFAENSRVRIVNQDFLKLDLAALVAHAPVKVIGNLPFNAASAVLHRLCGQASLISRMALMFQREVGERIRACPGDSARSALSVFTALYWEVAGHFRVLAGSFHPRPNVDAEVIVMRPRPAIFAPAEERIVLETIRAAFSAPRKAIRNSLAGALGIGTDLAAAALCDAQIDSSARAAALLENDFVRLARHLAARCPGAYAGRRDA
ncbi:MAG: 16S rRNA (adenine(1518)-N(6)/adenine(1519)-N(6))-dimethyltransferase RsmA [Candidatus Binataceae bacterium]